MLVYSHCLSLTAGKKKSSPKRRCTWVDILTPIHPRAVLLVDRNVQRLGVWLWQVIPLSVSYLTKPIYVHLKQTSGLWNVIAQYSTRLLCFVREERTYKIRQTQTVFLQSLKQITFSAWDSSACWPGCQPECGQSLSLSFLPVESASQLFLFGLLIPLKPLCWLFVSTDRCLSNIDLDR